MSSAPPPAQLSITVTADPDDAIAESDETNNAKSETTTVSGTVCGGLPCVDLLATATGTPDSSAAGGVAVYVATVTNVGNATVPDSPAWSIDFTFTGAAGLMQAPAAPAGVTCLPIRPGYRCTSTAGGADAMDLGPGASVSFVVTVIDLTPAGGVGLFQVIADPTSVVTELTTGNNIAPVVTAIQ